MDKLNYKVSVITVSYNSAKTIEQTIRSVLGQTYKNVEYIVIDGASTDGTQQMIEKYADDISYYISEQDDGIYYAMNKGIEKATGDIIGIINSDDWYSKSAVEDVVKCFTENDTDIVYGEVMRVERDETISETRKVDSLADIWYGMTIWHPAVFVRKGVYQKLGGFSIDYEISADYEFILRCYSNKIKFTYLDKVLSFFRSAGISNTQHIKCAEETNAITLKYMEQAPDKGRVLEENRYRLKKAIFREKYDINPQLVIDAIPWIKNKKVIVWGTGVWGREVIAILKNSGIQIDCLVDNNQKKEGTCLLAIEIKNPSLLEKCDSYVIIATRAINRDIQAQLERLGVVRERYLFLEEWITIVADKEECY